MALNLIFSNLTTCTCPVLANYSCSEIKVLFFQEQYFTRGGGSHVFSCFLRALHVSYVFILGKGGLTAIVQ